MKSSIFKILFLGLSLSIAMVSCSKDEKTEEATMTAEEATINARLNIMNEDITNIVDEQLTVADGISAKTASISNNFLPLCATVTRVPDFGTVPTVGALITKTIDFGTLGCPMSNGNVLKGKIIITFTYEPTATSHTINYQFMNFYHNAVKLEGNKNFTRVMTAATAASPSHPIITMNMDMTATFPNGNIHTRVGSRIGEIISGYNTPLDWTDNVYSVTGSWTTSFPNASSIESTITTPLIVKLNCANIVQGIITFVRNTRTATLDYGNGTCDNQAVFTINGVSYTITLG